MGQPTADEERAAPAEHARAALADLLAWVRHSTEGYAGVHVGSTRAAWNRDFSDGRVFCALLHAADKVSRGEFEAPALAAAAARRPPSPHVGRLSA